MQQKNKRESEQAIVKQCTNGNEKSTIKCCRNISDGDEDAGKKCSGRNVPRHPEKSKNDTVAK
jgi:hypothetical protein